MKENEILENEVVETTETVVSAEEPSTENGVNSGAPPEESVVIKSGNDKKQKVVIIILTLIIVALLAVVVCTQLGDTDSEIEKPSFEEGTLFDMTDTTANEKGSTSIPVLEDFTVSKASPVCVLYNPVENQGNSYLKYTFTNNDTGEVFYESDLVEPGLQFQVAFGDMFDVGTYNVGVSITSYDYDDPTVQHQTGTNTNITMTVTE